MPRHVYLPRSEDNCPVRCNLNNINISGLEFGVRDLIVVSEEERAVLESSENFFAVDIDENVRRRLQDKVGIPAEVRQYTVRRVFGGVLFQRPGPGPGPGPGPAVLFQGPAWPGPSRSFSRPRPAQAAQSWPGPCLRPL